MVNMIILLIFLGFIGFLIYLLVDLIKTGPNKFFDVWTKKTLWVWLPFYALRRIILEMFFDRK